MKLDSNISAVITGGASGLGAATATALAEHGVKVALFDLNEEKGEALAKELQKFTKALTAPYKYPRKIAFVDDLPKTTTGKIQRRILKQREFEAAQNRP